MPKVPNKIVYNGNTLIDITDTTAEPANVKAGLVFYDKAGVRQVGTGMFSVETEEPTRANEKKVNKAEFGGSALLDITDTTATPSTVEKDYVFYDCAGVRQVGEYEAVVAEDVAYYLDQDVVGQNNETYTATTLYFFGDKVQALEDAVTAGTAYKYAWANTGTSNPQWYSKLSSSPYPCTKIVFDESAKNVKPTSCFSWFRMFRNCNQIDGVANLDTSSVTNMN